MKISNFYCHSCNKNVASQEVAAQKHRDCGGRVTWRSNDITLVRTMTTDENKSVPV